MTAVIVHNPELESGQPRIICINLSLDGPSDRRPCSSLCACFQALHPSSEGTLPKGDRLQHQPMPGVNECNQQGHNFYGAVEKPRKIEVFIAGDELAEKKNPHMGFSKNTIIKKSHGKPPKHYLNNSQIFFRFLYTANISFTGMCSRK